MRINNVPSWTDCGHVPDDTKATTANQRELAKSVNSSNREGPRPASELWGKADARRKNRRLVEAQEIRITMRRGGMCAHCAPLHAGYAYCTDLITDCIRLPRVHRPAGERVPVKRETVRERERLVENHAVVRFCGS